MFFAPEPQICTICSLPFCWSLLRLLLGAHAQLNSWSLHARPGQYGISQPTKKVWPVGQKSGHESGVTICPCTPPRKPPRSPKQQKHQWSILLMNVLEVDALAKDGFKKNKW